MLLFTHTPVPCLFPSVLIANSCLLCVYFCVDFTAVIVAEATDSLQTKLREAEQTAATPDPPSSQLQSDSEKTSEKNDMGSSYNTPSVAPGNKMAAYEDLKLQVQSIGQQAIDSKS